MFCPKCGNEMPDGVQFCSQCGNAIRSADTVGDASNVGNASSPDQQAPGVLTGAPSSAPQQEKHMGTALPNVPSLGKLDNSKTIILIVAIVAAVVIVAAVIFGITTCGRSSSSSLASTSSSSSDSAGSSASSSSSADSGGSSGYSHSERVTGSDNVPGLSIQNVSVSRSGGDYNVDAKVYNNSSTYAYKDVKVEVTLIDATGRALAKATVDARPVSSSGIIGESSGAAIIKAAMAYAGTASTANVKVVSATRLSR